MKYFQTTDGRLLATYQCACSPSRTEEDFVIWRSWIGAARGPDFYHPPVTGYPQPHFFGDYTEISEEQALALDPELFCTTLENYQHMRNL